MKNDGRMQPHVLVQCLAVKRAPNNTKRIIVDNFLVPTALLDQLFTEKEMAALRSGRPGGGIGRRCEMRTIEQKLKRSKEVLHSGPNMPIYDAIRLEDIIMYSDAELF